VCGKGVVRRGVEHQIFKKSGQRKNYVLNNFDIPSPYINIITVV
jgi:hypothetical protein